MNNWTIIGIISLCIGLFLVVIGVSSGFNAVSAFDELSGFLGSYGEQLKNQAFMAAATPYLVSGCALLIVGIIGLIAGASPTNEKIAIQAPMVQNAPTIQTVKCPSCGQNMVFNKEKQRWYCQRENFFL